MIIVENASKSFDDGKSFSVRNISFQVAAGEMLVLVGSSGSGKTTTLKMLNRLIEATSGNILIQEKNIHEINPILLRQNIGYVFQSIGLFPHLTISENISIVLRLMGKSKRVQQQRAKTLLSLVNLEPEKFAHCYPHELSGGQQQRVGVARALAADPAILLMDEPFGALDALTREDLQQELLRLKNQLHKTIILVTHDINEAIRLGDRIGIMHRGQLEQIGTIQEISEKPASPFVEALLKTHWQQMDSAGKQRT